MTTLTTGHSLNGIPLLDRPLRECTVPAMLVHRARSTPDDILLSDGEQDLTAQECLERVVRWARLLSDLGIERGDRAVFISENHIDFLLAMLGVTWIGGIAVPLNTALALPQLTHALRDSGAARTIVDPTGLELVRRLDGRIPIPDVHTFDELLPSLLGDDDEHLLRDDITAASSSVRPSDPSFILYTSGTTGVAKGVLCPHAQMYWWGRNVGVHMRLGPDDVLFTTLPLFHTNAINAFFQALVMGSRYVITGRFSASQYWAQIEGSGATFSYLLGSMIGMLLNRSGSEYRPEHQLRAVLSPATNPDMCSEFRNRFGVLPIDGFGSTETNYVIGMPLDDVRPGFMGHLLPGMEARVMTAEDGIAEIGEPGELLLRCRQPWAFALGYWNLPEMTVETNEDMWFHTGDRVSCDADGYFRFVDRIKDVIRRRGENISSLEVEEAALRHPAVLDAAAYGVASDIGEEEVQITVELSPGSEFDPDSIIETMSAHIQSFATPRFIAVTGALPRTANGKVNKSVLRDDPLRDGQRWDRNDGQRRNVDNDSGTITSATSG